MFQVCLLSLVYVTTLLAIFSLKRLRADINRKKIIVKITTKKKKINKLSTIIIQHVPTLPA